MTEKFASRADIDKHDKGKQTKVTPVVQAPQPEDTSPTPEDTNPREAMD